MDLRVIGDTFRYGIRVSAIILHEGKLLAYQVEDQHHLVGGAIQLGESSQEAVAREVKEELGLDCLVKDCMFVLENRFDYQGELHHMIEFHYLVEIMGQVPSQTLDEGAYPCQWLDLDKLASYDLRPSYLKEKVPSWQGSLEHIQVDDRLS